ncbi:GNAT family N-acetyltransferase [Tepidibacter hydrothermalis]|uniref:GNAT family N-acetyltransferase n=1 Tax=Tepidibacter hydrothermalis TaxID=3036126 RepID=A0ABY8EE60_9FIRM|nr:GNAT family N-acetyltransferase [Tepidibacter hydrothermalis]WFD10180.1 GNAT family N-acetyltransferase [Tepidibacter hydrothermalis]
MIIRDVSIEDLDSISSIEADCFPKAEAAAKEVFKERISVFPEGFLAGEIDGKIIGFINGGLTDSNSIKDEFFESMDFHNPNGKNMVIFGLDVHPNHQKKGYATELMNQFISICRDKNISNIILTCKEHLIKYYEQFGYVNEDVSESVHGGAKWYDMTLKL